MDSRQTDRQINPGSFDVFGWMRVRGAVWRGAVCHAEGIVRAGTPDSQRTLPQGSGFQAQHNNTPAGASPGGPSASHSSIRT